MAMRVVIGLSRASLLAGAGLAGSTLVRDGRWHDILAELQDTLKGVGNSGEKVTDAVVKLFEILEKGTDAVDEWFESFGPQVQKLLLEVWKRLPTYSTTVHNGNSGGNSGLTGLTTLILPAATLGGLGCGYMWWKGISLSNFMYVTKRNMANDVSSMTKKLEQVSASLSGAMRHLTQQINRLDDKLDEQKHIAEKIEQEVTDARMSTGSDIKAITQLVQNLGDKISVMEEKRGLLQLVDSEESGNVARRSESGNSATLALISSC
ncbi:uncharacterized protein LOC109716092 isoform X2 [Ananas comosus]|uniref:Uncharacterized protein LOC109716092 isoform X2 n=1 Tax=Ananas comosus TaxID=4615 RepID=A0A6P5FMX1_ANACO|nr:uncharacterized protein LOC109716092 isoform X2 [Ananas comosus]XP_020096993.1 uncharacterized protein LOC109716092 isoform X2 [Ananas comosus]XP_020096994.1 uncharacterized protein LOC109716092 isoform X2 [Ananas comosus]XP_020096995.1 uncharacterized protein LOC109716092 isoform X2 [Ananas comosus]XP_020096996.1 uncharacterized protein LOC109716092 isoform X2 [Ananas comosus]XP_020096997.1 uncharacterized protein LOC109716092 isoform X2 [Ananas comosus]